MCCLLYKKKSFSVANLTLSTVPAAAGWFRPDTTSAEFFACDTMSDCVGGMVDQQCAPGHGGILCAVCDNGFIRQNGVCTACANQDMATDGTGGIIIATIVPSILLFLALLLYFCRKNKAEKTDDQQTQTQNKQKNNKQNNKQNSKQHNSKKSNSTNKKYANCTHKKTIANKDSKQQWTKKWQRCNPKSRKRQKP